MPLPTWLKLPEPPTDQASRSDLTAVARQDSSMTLAADNSPLRVIYGLDRLPARVANALIYEGKLLLQVVWGEGVIEGVQSVTIGDVAMPASVTATHYTGTSGQTVDATMVAAFATIGATYTDALPGIAYSVFKIPTDVSQGFPTIMAVIKGRKVLDPRTGITAWSGNPALCLGDFIQSMVYGLGRVVDTASLIEAANANDELVGTEKRRLIGLTIDSIAPTRQHMEALRTYAGCWLDETTGYIKLVPDRPRAVDHTVGAVNIKEGTLKVTKQGVMDVPTVMDIRWMNTTTIPWSEQSAIVYAPGVLAGTTARRESRVPLLGIHRYSQAVREATERLNHFWLEDLDATWEQFDEAIRIQKGDVISLTHPLGFSGKQLRVIGVTSSTPGRWTISTKEYDPAAYSSMVSAEPTYADTNLPNPAAPPALTGVSAVEEVYQLDNGTYASRIKAEWGAASYVYLKHYRVEVYQGGNLVATLDQKANVFRTAAVQEGVEYVVRVAAVTAIGATGPWAQANITPQGKFLVPGNVPSVTIFEAGGTVYGSCAPAIDVDIWRYEWRYGTVSSTWETSPYLIDRVDALRMTSAQIPVGTWRIFVKALDSVGQYSTTATFADVTVTSDASAFLVDNYDSNAPTLTNMQAFTLARTDLNTYYVTEDNVAWDTKFSAAMDTYTRPLADYHASVTSTWLGEPEDFGQLLGGQWTGTSTVAAVSGALISSMGFATVGAAPADFSFLAGLSQRTNARFAKLRHEALTTATLLVTVPAQNIRLDAVPREEVGTGTSLATGLVKITLVNRYVATKKLTITPKGTTARSATFDNIVLGNPTSFDVYIFNDAGVQIASEFQYTFQGV